MRSVHIIPLDTHCQSTEYGVMTRSGQLTHRGRCPTTVPALRAVIESVPRPRHVVLEEGPLADWLWRNLRDIADEVVVCDPRRNHLIARDGDKDDAIDVEKLGQLYRGNNIRRVHHSESEDRAFFKQLVSMYHRRVREAVRLGNQALYELRRHGIVVTTAALKGPERQEVLARLPNHSALRTAVRLVLGEYDQMRDHTAKLRREIIKLRVATSPSVDSCSCRASSGCGQRRSWRISIHPGGSRNAPSCGSTWASAWTDLRAAPGPSVCAWCRRSGPRVRLRT